MQRLAGTFPPAPFNNTLAIMPASKLSAFVLQLTHLPLHQPVLFLGLLSCYFFLLPLALSDGLHRVSMKLRQAGAAL